MNRLVDVGTAVLLVAGIFVLTRPGSTGGDLIRSLTGGFAQIVGVATGQSTVAAPRSVRTQGTGGVARRGGGGGGRRGGRKP